MANTNHSINSQYKLISNLISTKSDRDFNILINNIAGNIKNLISSESKKSGFTVETKYKIFSLHKKYRVSLI